MSNYAAEGADRVFCCQLGRCYHILEFILRNSLFDILRFLCVAMIAGYYAGNGRAFSILTGKAGGLTLI